MTSVCLYFKVHQPYRLKKFTTEDIGVNHTYRDVMTEKKAIDFAADKCYLPANEILYRLIKDQEGNFRVSFSISGTTMELLQLHRPDVLDSFKKLTATGCVEIMAETYYHSLSFLHSKKEFQRQVEIHSAQVKELFGTEPLVFRNTELIYNNELARFINQLGYRGILCEGVERILQGRPPNRIYAAPDNGDFGLFLRNSSLSDDIAFRFGDTSWSQYPLTAEKFANWIHAFPEANEVINLFIDYETFGIHKKKDSGVFSFLEALPEAILSNDSFSFSTPSVLLYNLYPRDIYDVPKTISWEDKSDVACVWSTNTMQNNTVKKIYALEKMVLNSHSELLMHTWGQLQPADYFYYMKEDGQPMNKYQNPFENAAEASANYYNILVDFEISLIKNNMDLTNKGTGFKLPAFNHY